MEYKRYTFVDWNGISRGIENVDDLKEAIYIAMEFQCEVIDTQATGDRIVFSVWEGWNPDYDFYNPQMKENIMKEVIRRESLK